MAAKTPKSKPVKPSKVKKKPAKKAPAKKKATKEKSKKGTAAKKKPARGTPKLSMAKYEKMWAAYQEQPSVAHVAKVCGITHETATRYIVHGFPEHGMTALKARMQAVQKQVQAVEEISLAEFKIREIRRIDRMINTLAMGEMELHEGSLRLRLEAAKGDGGIALPAESMKDFFAGLEKLYKLRLSMSGEADIKVNVEERTPNWLANMTPEERAAFLVSGVMPAASREKE